MCQQPVPACLKGYFQRYSFFSENRGGLIMVAVLSALVLFGIGFSFGYGIRELISRRRRAIAREEWLRRQDEKRHGESGGVQFS